MEWMVFRTDDFRGSGLKTNNKCRIRGNHDATVYYKKRARIKQVSGAELFLIFLAANVRDGRGL